MSAFTPKSIVCLREGYTSRQFVTDLGAGVTVSVVALPLAMAKFIPYPVTTGFTSGIAVIIFSTQIRNLFGLRMQSVPSEFLEKIAAYGQAAPT